MFGTLVQATFVLVTFVHIIATLGSILDSQLSWESGKSQFARWNHNMALLSWNHPRTAHLFWTHRCRGYIGGILRVSGECSDGVSWVSGGCLENVWRLSWKCLDGCLVSDLKVSGGWIKRVSGKNYLSNIFFGLQIFDTYGKDRLC